MSWFICSKCRCVDNVELVVPEQYVMDEEYPNMSKKDMLDESHPVMLCSECNTGTWHGKFDKRQAIDGEVAVASYSRYNMISKYDQDDSIVAKNDGGRYILTDAGIYMFNQMYAYATANNLKNVNIKEHPMYRKVVKLYGDIDMDELKNFDISTIEQKIREAKLNGYSDDELRDVASSSAEGDKMSSAMDNIKLQERVEKMAEAMKPQPHWKELQSDEDREMMLKRAELKREIKQLKKESMERLSKLKDELKQHV